MEMSGVSVQTPEESVRSVGYGMSVKFDEQNAGRSRVNMDKNVVNGRQ
jgi:hypothetical protein